MVPVDALLDHGQEGCLPKSQEIPASFQIHGSALPTFEGVTYTQVYAFDIESLEACKEDTAVEGANPNYNLCILFLPSKLVTNKLCQPTMTYGLTLSHALTKQS